MALKYRKNPGKTRVLAGLVLDYFLAGRSDRLESWHNCEVDEQLVENQGSCLLLVWKILLQSQERCFCFFQVFMLS